MASLEEIDEQLVRAQADARPLARLRRRMDEARRALQAETDTAADLAGALTPPAGPWPAVRPSWPPGGQLWSWCGSGRAFCEPKVTLDGSFGAQFSRAPKPASSAPLPRGAVDLGGGLRFADFFLDGLIADWMVQSRIGRAAEAAVAAAASDVTGRLDRLGQLARQAHQALQAVATERAALLAPEGAGTDSP